MRYFAVVCVWSKIRERLADNGFLRSLKGGDM